MTRLRPCPRRRQLGMSLLEVLFASLIMLIISVAILPLFYRSVLNIRSGRESSKLAGFGKQRTETIYPEDFNAPDWTVPAGSTNTQAQEFWLPGPDLLYDPGAWAPAYDDSVHWRRTVTVRQFGLYDLNDNRIFDAPLDGTVDPGKVQIKEVTIQIDGDGANRVNPRRLRLRYLKAF